VITFESAPQVAESARTVIVLSAIAFAVFWKVLLKIIVMTAVIVLVVLLVSGAVVLFGSINGAAG